MLDFNSRETAVRWFLGKSLQVGHPIHPMAAWQDDDVEMTALNNQLSKAVSPLRTVTRIGKSMRPLVVGCEIVNED
jgi:hypothetical protein